MPNDQTNSFHHYVPKFLLEYFAVNNKFWVYDRDKKEYRQQTPKSTAGEKGFYTFNTKDGEKLDNLEKMFTQIEGKASSVIKKLVEGQSKISFYEKTDLAVFVAALYLRIPDNIESTQKSFSLMTKKIMSFTNSNRQYFDKMVTDIEAKEGKGFLGDKEKLQKMLVEEDYDLHFPKEYALRAMAESLTTLIRYFVQMSWYILIAPPKKAYLISDKPAFTFKTALPTNFYDQGIGVLAPSCETQVVLTPKISIYLSQEHSPKFVEIIESSADMVDELNKRIAICCHRYLISHSYDLLYKWVEKTKLKDRGQYHQVRVD